MADIKILVVDDESRLRKLVHDFLARSGYTVLEASNGYDAIEIFSKNKDISIIILDIMMPEMDGWETAKEIRRKSNVPIMMLTARTSEQDELKGFEIGIDEYITKPFSPRVLVARVEAILRRTINSSGRDIIEKGGIIIDVAAHTVSIDGQQVDLSYKEYELLCFFMENAGVALSREIILDHVWNYDYYGDARTIDTHVKKLRSKMGNKGDLIKTVWGMGYKFEC